MEFFDMVAGARSLLSSRSLAIPQQLNGSASGCTIEANVLGRCPASYSSITCRHPHVKPLRKYSSSGGETRWLTPIDRTGDGARASGSNHPSSSNTRCTTLVPTPAVSSLSFLCWGRIEGRTGGQLAAQLSQNAAMECYRRAMISEHF